MGELSRGVRGVVFVFDLLKNFKFAFSLLNTFGHHPLGQCRSLGFRFGPVCGRLPGSLSRTLFRSSPGPPLQKWPISYWQPYTGRPLLGQIQLGPLLTSPRPLLVMIRDVSPRNQNTWKLNGFELFCCSSYKTYAPAWERCTFATIVFMGFFFLMPFSKNTWILNGFERFFDLLIFAYVRFPKTSKTLLSDVCGGIADERLFCLTSAVTLIILF